MQPPLLRAKGEPGINREAEQKIMAVRQRIYNAVHRRLFNRCDAEDVTQETLLRAWSSYASYNPERSFDAWVFRIAYNVCIDHLRCQKRRQECSLDAQSIQFERQKAYKEPADLSNDPAVRLLAQEVDEPIEMGLRILPAPYLQCVLLLQRGHSYEEIAALMHCPLGTVRSRLHRARNRLRAVASAYGEGTDKALQM
jgi:RNA polymerase sigma-70 factor (ECF subfamily)